MRKLEKSTNVYFYNKKGKCSQASSDEENVFEHSTLKNTGGFEPHDVQKRSQVQLDFHRRGEHLIWPLSRSLTLTKGICPKGFECDHIVCAKSQRLLCTQQTPPNSLTSGAHSACFCAGCLNSPLFSLLILAVAACEAWIDDNESKRLTWAPG